MPARSKYFAANFLLPIVVAPTLTIAGVLVYFGFLAIEGRARAGRLYESLALAGISGTLITILPALAYAFVMEAFYARGLRTKTAKSVILSGLGGVFGGFLVAAITSAVVLPVGLKHYLSSVGAFGLLLSPLGLVTGTVTALTLPWLERKRWLG